MKTVERGTLDKTERRHLRDLTGRLEAAGYNEQSVCDLLDLYEIYEIRESVTDRNLQRAEEDTPLAHLAAFWLLGQAREKALLERLMGSDTLSVLHKLSLVEMSPHGVRAGAHLFPCLERWLFLDLIAYRGESMYQVYWLGSDSLALARTAPRREVETALDLCTGSGVHAIMAGGHARQSWAVDINPRALEYCRINAVLNGLEERCSFYQGSLYEPLPAGQFGLVTANPPFVPTPRGDLALFRPGGESGEEITAGIIAGLPQRLEVGGTMALVSQCPVMRNSHPLDRVEQWLGGSQGWGLAQIRIGRTLDRDKMIADHITPSNIWTTRLGPVEGMKAYRKEFDTWLQCYEENGILGADLAMTFVRRLQHNRPGWRADWLTNLPKGSRSDWVGSWLDAQERFSAHATDWSWRPAWSDLTSRVMVDARGGPGLALYHDMALCPQGMTLEEPSAFLMQEMDGQKTAQQLLDAFASRYKRTPAKARAEVSERLDHLGRHLLLT